MGGGLLGNAIEKQGKTKTEWTVAVKLRNGKTETVKTQQDPQVKAGDLIKSFNNCEGGCIEQRTIDPSRNIGMQSWRELSN